MRCRYIFFVVLCTLIHILCWYYVIVFCSIYSQSSWNWIYGAVTSLIIDWFGTGLLVPFAKTLLQIGIRKLKCMQKIFIPKKL